MSTQASRMLVTELLGYQPQLLLDELMSCVNETIYEAVAHVENFLNKWIDEKEEAGEDVEKMRQEVDYVSTFIACCDAFCARYKSLLVRTM